MPTIKSWYKFTENKRLSVSSYKYLAKAQCTKLWDAYKTNAYPLPRTY